MALFEWQPCYEVGAVIIDQQHQQLVNIINQLNELLETTERSFATQEFNALLQRLFDYTRYHFTTEEDLMAESGYPADLLSKHKRQHQRFIAEINTCQLDIEDLTRNDAENIHQFLVDWLKNHILKSDAQLVPFLAKKTARSNNNDTHCENTVGNQSTDQGPAASQELSVNRIQTWSLNAAIEELVEVAEYASRQPNDFAQDKLKQRRLAYLAHKLKLDLSALLK